MNSRVYFSLFFGLWGWSAWLAYDAFALGMSNQWIAWAWLTGYSFLIMNVVYIFLTALSYLVVKPSPLAETYVSYIPKTAIIYPVKNEDIGMFERISFTLENNNLPGVHLWILSDSDSNFLESEHALIQKLREQFGKDKIYYRHREHPSERKQGNVLSWLVENLYYKYFFVCDADSMAPKGTLLKLIKKAEHPDNANVSLFQTFIKITHAKTRYSKLQSIGSRLSQELYFKTYQQVFGTTISFGHLCLIRSKDFAKIKIPKGILSHDIWDTAYLDRMGKKLAFCHDVKTWDEAPANYLEEKVRAKRWAKGTLQSWPLLFKKGISFSMKFYVFYGIYVYISHLVLLGWFILNLLLGFETNAQWLFLKSNNKLFISPFMRQELLIGLLLTLGVIYLHRFVLLKRAKFKDIFTDIVFSTLISLNNIYYLSLDLILFPFEGLSWNPMKKNPFSKISLKQVIKTMWPTTIIGIIGLYYGCQHTGLALWISMPLLLSFSFSIPVVYWTSQPLSKS